jgi:phosphatidyl-myo-inositol dimannoside synthase
VSQHQAEHRSRRSPAPATTSGAARRLARERAVSEVVRFLGHVPDLEPVDHDRMADLFVMPGTIEGFGIVFLEAMACGIPAIGGDADGSVDPLSGSSLGKAVPPEQVGEAIARILEASGRDRPSPALAERFGFQPLAAQLAALSASRAPGGR